MIFGYWSTISVNVQFSYTCSPKLSKQNLNKTPIFYIGNKVSVFISGYGIYFHLLFVYKCEGGLTQFLVHIDVNKNRDATWDADWAFGKLVEGLMLTVTINLSV